MKILHYTLLGLIILTFGKINGQNLKGIWISSYNMELRAVNERYDIQDNEFLTIKLDSTVIDTFYYEAYMLFDFIDDKNVIVKRLSGRQEKCKYSIKDDKLRIKIKRHKINGRIIGNSIVIVNKISKTKNRETFFERIVDSKIVDKTGIDSVSFINTNWLVETDTASHNYGFNFHFLDNSIVIITQDYGDFGYTNWGEWQIDWYKNHLFVSIVDRSRLETKTFHFFDKIGNILIGNTYEHHFFGTKPPLLKNIELSKKELFDTIQLTTLEKNLYGKWIAINNPLSVDTAFRDLHKVDTVLNQKFEIDFNSDKTFRLEKSGVIVKQADKTYKQDTLIGDWEISKTGKYIVLKPKNSWIKYLTINNLESDYLEIFCDIETIYDEHMIKNEIVKMKKITGSN